LHSAYKKLHLAYKKLHLAYKKLHLAYKKLHEIPANHYTARLSAFDKLIKLIKLIKDKKKSIKKRFLVDDF